MPDYAIRELVRDKSVPFREWFNRIDTMAANKVTTALYRLQYGNFSNVKSVGNGVSEYKIDFGPGYRIYFGLEGNTLIILLCGGTKKTQQSDINKAIKYWLEYKTKKRQGGKHGVNS
jgi:putative addiction module killer protein